MAKRFLLDTGMLLGFVRNAPWALRVRTEFDLGDKETMVFTSVICQGELLALAEKNGWGEGKRNHLDKVLNGFPTLDINKQPILRAYALIDAWTHGNPVASPEQALPPKPAVPMKQNDLWIAATAHESKATLLSTDNDFAHLNNVWLRFEYVDQNTSQPQDCSPLGGKAPG